MEGHVANEARFSFTVAGASDVLSVLALSGREAVSQLFEFQLDLVASHPDVDFDAITGAGACLLIDGLGGPRFVNGIVSGIRFTGMRERQATYQATLVPWPWLLRHRQGCRIFQDQSVPDIIARVFRDAGIPIDAWRFCLQDEYPKRRFCVQYRESELDFVHRLMEDEGIYYFFEHQPDRHTLVMGDDPLSHPRLDGGTTIDYWPDANLMADHEFIHRLHFQQEVRPGRLSLKSFNFRKPNHDLAAAVAERVGAAAGLATREAALEVYDYPATYRERHQGERLAQVRLEEQRVDGAAIDGSSPSVRLTPGYFFSMQRHPRRALNQEYLITGVTHSGTQPQVLEAEAGVAQQPYAAEFTAIPARIPFRPPRSTPRPVMPGPQTAWVVGPTGEEIYVDRLGRVKVQFHWDREGQRDERSSCWVRVSQSVAGGTWGSMIIPRIGQEVIVDFEDGDPDRPLVTGRVYNGTALPPFTLPAQANVCGMKSQTVKGQGYNEISFNDTAGKEHFKMHAQHDQSSVVGNDKSESIGRHLNLKVAQNRSESVGENQSVDVGIDRSQSIGGSDTLTVAVNRTKTVGIMENALAGVMRSQTTGMADIKTTGLVDVSVAGVTRVNATGFFDTHLVGLSQTTLVGNSYSVQAFGKAVIEAPEIVLKAGGGIIKIDGSGVCIEGTDVWINCGKCGGGGAGGGGGAAAGGAGGAGAGSGGGAGAEGLPAAGFAPPPGSNLDFDLGAMLNAIADAIPGLPSGVGDVLQSIANGNLPEVADILRSIPPSALGQHGQEILNGLQTAYGHFENPPSLNSIPGLAGVGSGTGQRPNATTNPNDPGILYAAPETGGPEFQDPKPVTVNPKKKPHE